MNAPLKGKELAEFRKLSAPDQLRALRGQKVERVFTVDRANGVDKEARTVWLSIASDAPYERWWGTEILDMAPGSIRQDRLKSGAPLLVGHDTADQVGVVENYEIAGDKKLRVLARFGRSARAEEIFQDVLDGIRRNASVGYVIHDLVLEKQEEGVSTYRVNDWEPLEGSIVPVPADPSVGVGRELERQAPPIPIQEKNMNEEERKAKEAAEAKARADAELKAKAEQDAIARERERVGALTGAGNEYRDFGGVEIAAACVKDGSSIEVFRSKVLEAMRNKTVPTTTAAPGTGSPGGDRAAYGESARVLYRYSKLNAFRDLPLEGGGVMKAEEAAYRAGMWLAATVYRKDWGLRWCRDHNVPFVTRNLESGRIDVRSMVEARVASENVLSSGGALVPIEMEAAIIMLRDTYGVARRLCRIRPMGTDQLRIPRRKGGITAYYFQDDDGVGITASDKAWDNVTLSAKKLGALGRLSKDLIEDAVISVADDMAQEQAYAFAVKEDNALLVGDGTSTYGGINGIITKMEATAYKSRIALTTGHNLFTEVDNTDLTSVHAGVAQFARQAGPVWLCSGEFAASVFDRLKATAGGNTVATLGQSPDDSYLRFPIITSEAMPAGVATDYVNKVMALFGKFDMGVSFGVRRGIEVQTLLERYAELGQIGVLCTERHDIVVHDLGDTNTRGPISAAYGA